MSVLRRPGRRRVGALTVMASLALVASACGSGPAAEGDSASSAPELSMAEMAADLETLTAPVTSLPEVPAVDDVAALAGKTVWWVPLGTQVDASYGPNVRKALGSVGIDVHTCDGKFLPTTVASCLQQATDQKADAVVTGYVDYKAVPTAFDALEKAGIPVLLAGAANNSGKKQSPTFAFADATSVNQRTARTQLEEAITDTDGTGELVWIGLEDSAQLKATTDYARQFVRTNCPECTWTELMTTSASLGKLSAQVGATLTQRPDTDVVIAQIDPAVPPVLQAIQTTGKQDSVKVIGAGALPDTMLTLQKGDGALEAISGASLAYSAWSFSGALLQMLSGETPAGQIGSLHRLFTADNVQDLTVSPEEFGTVRWYTDPKAFEASFAEAWGVS